MSRVERHKERREGEITGIGREVNQGAFDVNPIIKKEDKEKDIKRKKTYNNSVVAKSLDIDAMKEKVSSNKKELFDIEEAFKRLKTKRQIPDYDTQLEIMAELFSDNGVEYNDTVEFEKDFETNRVMISEDELIKLLEEREKVHLKALEKKRKKEKRQAHKESKAKEEKTAPFIKEDLNIEEVSEIKEDDSIKKRLAQTYDNISEIEHKLTKRNWPLIIVLIVLVVVLVFLVYSFFK